MPTVIAHHDITETDHWLASPKREKLFGPLGVTNIRTFVNPEQPTKVAVLMDVPNLDAVMNVMQKQEAADAMAHDGVYRTRSSSWSNGCLRNAIRMGGSPMGSARSRPSKRPPNSNVANVSLQRTRVSIPVRSSRVGTPPSRRT